jgi:catechol 2,3-dioxygenase-like lactoylglutathione lyase family enzyme
MKRRIIQLWLLFAVSLTAAAQRIPVLSVGPIGMTVSDADRSVEFYSRVLQFTKVSDEEYAGEGLERAKNVFGSRARIVRMRLGTEEIELTQYLAPEGRPFPIGTRGNDRWFQHIAIIVRDMDQAYAVLRKYKVRHASPGPQTLPAWNKNAGGVRAFYFRDPDGHFLELLQFPAGKGDVRWRRPGNDLFMGIDHTAITISDTERALKFYRDELGFQIAGTSENYGPEQEHLNNVAGARLRITALRGPAGPKIELLEYLSPRDGADYPENARANDLLHWETSVKVVDARMAFSTAQQAGLRTHSIAPGQYKPGDAEFLLKDPDGHELSVRSAHSTQFANR